jgi:tetratricopeptide (TPR) repeat protein
MTANTESHLFRGPTLMRILLAALLALVIAAPANAQQWYRAETNNFIIISQDSEEATREFASNLERFDMALRSLQNMPVGEEQPSDATKLTVFRFGDAGAIARAAEIPGIAGVYFGRAGESLALTPAREERRRSNSVTNVDARRAQRTNLDIVSVLQHEYVHYFMMQHFPAAYPRWYVEGYAELLATTRLNEDGSFHVGDPPLYRGDSLYYMTQFRLEEMLDQAHDLSGKEAYQHYTVGWLFAHYLNFNPERLTQLNTYLLAIQNGEDSLTAARRIFGDLDAIDSELRRYRGENLPGFDVRPAEYAAPTVEISRISGSRVDLMTHEIRLTRGTDKEGAAAIASSVAAYVVDHPDDAHALSLLASAQFTAENYVEAQATAERLIATDPTDIDGPIIASYVAAERSRDDAQWVSAALDHAVAANDIDRLDPRPKMAYYYAYASSGQEAPEAAAIALESAFDTAGSDAFYRILLARQLLVENRLPQAQSVLQPIAFRGHNQGGTEDEEAEEDADKPSLDKIMDFIRAGNRDAALTMTDDLIEGDDEA